MCWLYSNTETVYAVRERGTLFERVGQSIDAVWIRFAVEQLSMAVCIDCGTEGVLDRL